MNELTATDRVNTVYGGGGHVVLLGAGASIASTLKNPELNGKILPSMDNFIDVVGLRAIVNGLPDRLCANNFEDLYANLYDDNPHSQEIYAIEELVRIYFGDMKLPEVPTIYDYLVLSLRPRDLIATFNWDPFLYQAWNRNYQVGDLPYIAFLHGNVAIGYDSVDKRAGPAGAISRITYQKFEPTRLLFPVNKKNYNRDEFTKSQWDMTESFVSDKKVARFTVFGYGAPKSDVEAMQLLNKAWGTGEQRVMEQFEMIDIRDKDAVKQSWRTFINSHHYDFVNNYFESSLARNPRRTFESYQQHMFPFTIEEALSASNPVPSNFETLQELWDWHQPLIDAEKKWKSK